VVHHQELVSGTKAILVFRWTFVQEQSLPTREERKISEKKDYVPVTCCDYLRSPQENDAFRQLDSFAKGLFQLINPGFVQRFLHLPHGREGT